MHFLSFAGRFSGSSCILWCVPESHLSSRSDEPRDNPSGFTLNFHQAEAQSVRFSVLLLSSYFNSLPLKIFSSVWVCLIPANSIPFLHLVTHKTPVFSIDCVLVFQVRFLLPVLCWFFNLATPYGRHYMGQVRLGLKSHFHLLPLLRGPIFPVGRFFPLLFTSAWLWHFWSC